MSDRSDALVVRWVPQQGPPRRYRFEPRSDDTNERVEEWWNGCRWVPAGREVVTGVAVEGSDPYRDESPTADLNARDLSETQSFSGTTLE